MPLIVKMKRTHTDARYRRAVLVFMGLVCCSGWHHKIPTAEGTVGLTYVRVKREFSLLSPFAFGAHFFADPVAWGSRFGLGLSLVNLLVQREAEIFRHRKRFLKPRRGG